MVHQHLVELAAQDLPGLRGFVLHVLEEVKRVGRAAVRTDKLHAELLGVVRRLQLLDQPHPLQRKIRVRNQRLADVVAREFFLLEHQHAASLAGENRRCRGARGAAADNDHVIRLRWTHGYE
jgi:hypothetical protein